MEAEPPIQARLHAQMVRSMVEIRGEDPDTSEPTIFYGTTIVLEPHFAYVVVDPSYARLCGGRVSISFPGGPNLDYNDPTIHVSTKVAGICCPNPDGYNAASIREVPLCAMKPTTSQHVHLFSPNLLLLTSGVVIGGDEERQETHFHHNCASDITSRFGAPVVNDDGEFVGMCTAFTDQHLEATTTCEIASAIEESQGRPFKGVQHMLQHLRSFA